jgi:putative membrane-bound dehydrogenase-like protein
MKNEVSHRLCATWIGLLSAVLMAQSAPFPTVYNSEKNPGDGPMPAAEVAAKMKLPDGFKCEVIAAEPDVQNPIAMTWDGKGRLWVAENYTYAERPLRFDLSLRDRVVIFESTRGDGRFDKRTVFTDDVQMLTGIEVGRGGVWLMCPPRLMFVPDRNGDGVPDGPAEVVLDGFTVPQDNYHNFANGLKWGLDGWLYGRCGHSAPGSIGAPGSKPEERVPLHGTIWRYHPTRKVVEVLSTGTTNPWGHDWDDRGEMFFVNTVNGHLWHGIPGAHFNSGSTVDPNPRAYTVIDQHADHYHFDIGQGWTKSRAGHADEYGGGHAHIGCMIYQGDNWPAEYRGKLFTVNMHGRRINQEILERSASGGSGYVGKHGKDFMICPDTWFRGMELSYGPDGTVYLIDWSDTGECHESTGVHRTSGRIYRISYATPQKVGPIDLSKMSAGELVNLHTHANEWFTRLGRVELMSRSDGAAVEALKKLATSGDLTVRLRATWTLFSLGAIDEATLRAMLSDGDEHVRVTAIRMMTDAWPIDDVDGKRPSRAEAATADGMAVLVKLASSDPSGLVRLAVASAMQRMPLDKRAAVATALMWHAENAEDHNLPLLVWYGLTPVVDAMPDQLAGVAAESKWPLVRKYIARALAEGMDKQPQPLNALLAQASSSADASFRGDVLAGVAEGLAGVRKAIKPAAWDGFTAKITEPELLPQVQSVSVVFGDGRALDEVKAAVMNTKLGVAARRAALQTLIDGRPDDLKDICVKLLDDRQVNGVAVRGLAQFDDAAVAKKIAGKYRTFAANDRPMVIDALVSRPSSAAALLSEVANGKIPRSDVTPFHARQIRAFNDEKLTAQLNSVWGELRESLSDKKATIAKFKAMLTPEVLAKADKTAGKQVFMQTCAICHRLYGQGGEVGPDLTGSGRDNLDYLLDNIVDPSAVVTADFKLSIVTMKDGRILTGMLPAGSDKKVVLRTMTEKLTIDRGDIASVVQSPQSLMPEGLLDALGPEKTAQLIAFLMQK